MRDLVLCPLISARRQIILVVEENKFRRDDKSRTGEVKRSETDKTRLRKERIPSIHPRLSHSNAMEHSYHDHLAEVMETLVVDEVCTSGASATGCCLTL